jgi:hypothetical protein
LITKRLHPEWTAFIRKYNNYTAEDIRRLDLVSLNQLFEDRYAKVIIRSVIDNENKFDDPPPIIGVMELGPSSVDIAVKCG